MRPSLRIIKIEGGAILEGPLCGTEALKAVSRLQKLLHEELSPNEPSPEVRLRLENVTRMDSLGVRAILEAIPPPTKIVLEGLPLGLMSSIIEMGWPERVRWCPRPSNPENCGRELRRYPRFSCAIRLEFILSISENAHLSCEGVATNISRGGAYLEFLRCNCSSSQLRRKTMRKEGSLRHIHCFEILELPARVLRAQERQGQMGLALQFSSLDPETDSRIAQMVEIACRQ